MKRSTINAVIREADAFLKEHRFHLPPFAYWTPADWGDKGAAAREIVEHSLLKFGVQMCRRLVQQDQAGLPQVDACQRNALRLTARKPQSAFPQWGVEPIG